MKIVYNNIIPFPGYKAINLFGILFVRGTVVNSTIINHENIHTAQMKELLYIGFYIWYFIEWIIKLFKYGNGHTAYRKISFEKEAYTNQDNLDYLKSRKHYAYVNE